MPVRRASNDSWARADVAPAKSQPAVQATTSVNRTIHLG
jgi:hypothetical protein